jgi:hypothetical protein
MGMKYRLLPELASQTIQANAKAKPRAVRARVDDLCASVVGAIEACLLDRHIQVIADIAKTTSNKA